MQTLGKIHGRCFSNGLKGSFLQIEGEGRGSMQARGREEPTSTDEAWRGTKHPQMVAHVQLEP